MKITGQTQEHNAMSMLKEKWGVQINPGYLKPYLEMFAEELSNFGYTHLTIYGYMLSGAHLGYWLTHKSIAIDEIDENIILVFEKHNCKCPYVPNRHGVSRAYINRIYRIIKFLRSQGIVKPITPQPALENSVIVAFRNWLINHRGLSDYTIKRVVRLVGIFCDNLGYDPQNYSPKNIRKVTFAYANCNARGQTKCFVTAFRTFIKFLSSQGLVKLDLLSAIPTIPHWRLSALPKYLPESDIMRIIDSCDITTPIGIRDRAILLLLARLALRAGDIVSLRIQDINWNRGVIKLTGKGRTECYLPLPQEVGDAILIYLESARPAASVNELFLCTQAPWRAFAGPSVVSGIVAAAIRRSKIKNPPSSGTNLLRHSAATSMLRNGLELDAVSTILRHRSLDMTAYYAKVDVNMLQEIAQPWPGGTSC
jgi:site-specific recombinase XerD